MRQSIQGLLNAYAKREEKPSQVVSRILDRIQKTNKTLNAYLEVQPDRIQKRAAELDARISEVHQLPLFGVPIAVKDNILAEGWGATAGSKILEGYRSPYTATCVERLERAGAVIIGKTNCDEFAMGSSNETSAFGSVRNPWDLERVSGGSSGGSAVAVCADLALGALGTETGGSVRQPASLCGLVGIKPSYGRVSRYGIIAYASSLDQVGTFGLTVEDAARILELIAGFDPQDSTTSRASVGTYSASLDSQWLKEIKLGVPRRWLEGVEESVLKAFDQSLRELVSAGAQVIDVDIPHAKYGLSTYYILAPSEASSNLARFDGVHYGFRAEGIESVESLFAKSRGQGFGKEVKLRIMLGTYALSAGYFEAFYVRANRVRALLKSDFDKAFSKVDCIVVPTSPCTAFRLGEKTDDPIAMYLSDVFTLPVNLAGLPAISVPCGLDPKGLPIGLQLIGRYYGEANLFHTARAYEKIRGLFPSPPEVPDP